MLSKEIFFLQKRLNLLCIVFLYKENIKKSNTESIMFITPLSFIENKVISSFTIL